MSLTVVSGMEATLTDARGPHNISWVQRIGIPPLPESIIAARRPAQRMDRGQETATFITAFGDQFLPITTRIKYPLPLTAYRGWFYSFSLPLSVQRNIYHHLPHSLLDLWAPAHRDPHPHPNPIPTHLFSGNVLISSMCAF